MGDKLKRYLFKGDKTIWAVFFILCAISWVEVFSATSGQIKTGSYWSPIIKHTTFLVAGIVVVWIIHNMKVAWIKKTTHVIYWMGVVGLLWAQFFGPRINDSARWIIIWGMTIQPMEFAKMGLVMVTALISAQHQDEEGTDRFALKRVALYAVLPVLIIFKENLSTAAIILATIYAMMFISRYPKGQMWKILGGAVAAGIIGITLILSAPESWGEDDGFKQKIITWKHRIVDAVKSEPVTAENYVIKNPQRTYSHIAIASSHILGCGPGNSVQRDFIPHAQSDFIYAIIIEELGLLGGIIVLLLYMTILFRCGMIAKKCEDPYPAFLVMGVGMIITMQALLHMYISVGNFVTGQPLPLISQGGTSVIINCVYVGMILSISRYAKKATANPKQSFEEIDNENNPII
jgi:cell division protein FtsW